jgi:hypothetical protein
MAHDLQLFTNNAVTLLAAPISASATSLQVMTGYGSLFPNPGPGQFFLVTLEDQSGTNREIIRVNGRSGDVFTGLQRAQEGTVARAWNAVSGDDTLVDHRVTAETMRLAMLLPEIPPIPATLGDLDDVDLSTAPTTGQVLKWNGTFWSPAADNGTSGGGSVPGAASTAPVEIDPGWEQPVSTAVYSDYQRGFKFFVTLYMPVNHRSATFEVLGNVSGDLGANAEQVTWNRTARVGYNFQGTVNITLNTATKELELTWNNDESNPVEVMCTRIQHLP